MLGRAQAGVDIVGNVVTGIDAELESPRSVDLYVQVKGVHLLLQMGIDNPGDAGDTLAIILWRCAGCWRVVAIVDRAETSICAVRPGNSGSVRRHIWRSWK